MSQKLPRLDVSKIGFYYFITQFWEREKQDGRVLTFEEAKVKANWNGLTGSQRDEYKKAASKLGDKEVAKMVDVIQNLDYEREKAEREARRVVDDKTNEYFEFIMEKDYDKRAYYFVHVNWYVKADKIIYPGEICMLKYRVEKGIEARCLLTLDCGPFPIGYSLQINQRSEYVNKLAIPPPSNIALNYTQAKSAMVKFLGGQFPNVIFAQDDDDNNDLMAVKQTMHKIFAFDFSVVPVEKLLIALHDKYKPEIKMSFVTARKIMKEPRPLTKACSHHYEMDAVVYCSEAHVTRLALNMNDALQFGKNGKKTENSSTEEENESEWKENVMPSPSPQQTPKIAKDQMSTKIEKSPPLSHDTGNKVVEQVVNVAEENKKENIEKVIEIDNTPKTPMYEEFDLENLPF